MLADILNRHRIAASDLGRAITQTGGRRAGHSLSGAAMSALLNRGEYPKSTPREEVDKQIKVFLTGRGISPDELEGLGETGATVAAQRMKPGAGKPAPEPDEVRTMLPQSTITNKTARKKFKLRAEPFPDFPPLDGLYLNDAMRSAIEAYAEAAEYKALRCIVGESGSGKTTIKRYCVNTQGDVEVVDVLVTTMSESEGRGGKMLKSRDIHAAIIRHFKGEDASVPSDPTRLQLLTRRLLRDSAKAVLLQIDEAHDLNAHTLAHLKRLREMADGRLAVVLFGQPKLADKLNPRLTPDIKEAGQRFPIEWLLPLDDEVIRQWYADKPENRGVMHCTEIDAYLDSRLKQVGASFGAVFEVGAEQAIAEQLSRRTNSGLIVETYPLAVGNLAAAAMNLAANMGADLVSASIVAIAARGV
ncbi:MAG: AAA family ATPase [Candidatus Methylumidiphilus sp.]